MIPISTWKATLIVIAFGVVIAVAGAPGWLVYGCSLILAAALMFPGRIGERPTEPMPRSELARGMIWAWLPALAILAVAAAITGHGVAAAVIAIGAGTFAVFTRSR